LRRLIHLALLLAIMVGIRACGGMAATEDRLGAATRWMAERVGLGQTKQAFDAAVRPPMAAATRSLSDSIYATTARTMDSVEAAAGGFTGWVMQNIRAGLGLIDGSLQPVVAPAPETPPDPLNPKETEEERRARSR
jgi:hypothetical protein